MSAGGLDTLVGADVVVWGTGREGRDLVELLAGRAASLALVDDDPPPSGTVEIAGRPWPVGRPSWLEHAGAAVVVRSPGVPRRRPELLAAEARGVRVTTAMAVWLADMADAAVLGITGSKGKSTTATMAAVALEAGGLRVGLGGNVGKPVTAFYREPPYDAYVVEVSSYQAADVTVSPSVGVLTLLASDHLDWHGGEERYVADKLNLFGHRAGMPVAVNAGDGAAMAATAHLGQVPYGADGRLTVCDDAVAVDGSVVLGTDTDPPGLRRSLRAAHNRVNLCGALTGAALVAGHDPDWATFSAALAATPGLPSRLETVLERAGIEYVDDALASNPAGVVAALQAFAGRRVALIAGGRDRGVDVSALAAVLRAMEPPPVVVTLAAGGAAARLADALGAGGGVTVVEAADVGGAVALARDTLGGEGVVLLSPGAPTPPEEGSYEDRSRAFRSAALAVATPT